MNVLECQIYADCDSNEEFYRRISAAAGCPPTYGVIETRSAKVAIMRNGDQDPARKAEFPDGFLFFLTRIDVSADRSAAPRAVLELLTAILEDLWAAGIPAVAACDFERVLPNRGGYADTSVPWPTRQETG
jgi:hypothetical protein